jgi:hypothetical protein
VNFPTPTSDDSMVNRRMCAPHSEHITSGIGEVEYLSSVEVAMVTPRTPGSGPDLLAASRGLTPKDTSDVPLITISVRPFASNIKSVQPGATYPGVSPQNTKPIVSKSISRFRPGVPTFRQYD